MTDRRIFLGWIVLAPDASRGKWPIVEFYCRSKHSAKWFALRKLNMVQEVDRSAATVKRAWTKAREKRRSRLTIHRVYAQ